VNETVSDQAREDQWRVRSIDKVQHTEKSDYDFQRGPGRWTSKSVGVTVDEERACVTIRLNRNQVVEILRLVCCENLIC